ncbi:MAG: hypothetical protein LBI33_02200, partial [Propionibacteriaceae bacterium]|nr:hypothetical protein [Propionibacteriaceae bacterium]
MARVVAVDGGGTSTRCVVVESGGRCLGLATGGSGNPVSAGWSSASAAVAHTTVTALTQAGLTGADIDAVVLSIAGAGTVETDGFAEPLRALGIASPPVHKPDILASY